MKDNDVRIYHGNVEVTPSKYIGGGDGTEKFWFIPDRLRTKIKQGLQVQYREDTGYVMEFKKEAYNSYKLTIATGITTKVFSGLTLTEVKKIIIVKEEA